MIPVDGRGLGHSGEAGKKLLKEPLQGNALQEMGDQLTLRQLLQGLGLIKEVPMKRSDLFLTSIVMDPLNGRDLLHQPNDRLGMGLVIQQEDPRGLLSQHP